MKWGLYEPETLQLMRKRLRPGDVMVDVGANCGLYTLVAAQAVGASGRIIALEPSPREFERLERNVGLNGLRQVRCIAAAAADQAGQATLSVAQPPFAGHNTLGRRFAYAAVALAEQRTVPAITLDGLLRDEIRCDLIKLDIEGAELSALRGAAASLARLRPALLVEINQGALSENGASANDLLTWITEHGYAMYAIDPRTGQPLRIDWSSARSVTETMNVLALPV